MQNSLRSDSCIFAPDADSCELRVSKPPANEVRGTLFQGVPPGSLPSSRASMTDSQKLASTVPVYWLQYPNRLLFTGNVN